jgi:hypothetical protein
MTRSDVPLVIPDGQHNDDTAVVPWVVAADWDDTIKAGGNSRFLYHVQGISRRVKSSYPGVTTLLEELDPCWSSEQQPLLMNSKPTFEVWTAKPWGSKKPNKCDPPLHRKPITRHGRFSSGIRWVLANCSCASDAMREDAAKQLGRDKVRHFEKLAAAFPAPHTQILFFGDTGQGDGTAAELMVDNEQHGKRTFVFLHDITGETSSERKACFEDPRIAVKSPFQNSKSGDHLSCERINYYKTVPEAAFLLAQHGFLTRDKLRRVVEASKADKETGLRKRSDEKQGWLARRGVMRSFKGFGNVKGAGYGQTLDEDIDKCEELLTCDGFWAASASEGDDAVAAAASSTTTPEEVSEDFGSLRAQMKRPTAIHPDECATPRHVASIRRSVTANERARRARRFAEGVWRPSGRPSG